MELDWEVVGAIRFFVFEFCFSGQLNDLVHVENVVTAKTWPVI